MLATTMNKSCVLHVAIATPIRRLFDYLPADATNIATLLAGMRVSVPFGHRQHVVGMIVSIDDVTNCPPDKLKRIDKVLDEKPILTRGHLDLLTWASQYYHHPIGEVIFTALPVWLRKNNSSGACNQTGWKLTEKGENATPNEFKQTVNQTGILEYLQQSKQTVLSTEIQQYFPRSGLSLVALEKKALVEKVSMFESTIKTKIIASPFKLNEAQASAIKTILDSSDRATTFLLDGLTGSGKTEIYMAVMAATIRQDKQCLVLLPEISLTPQHIQRFRERFHVNIAVQHSGLNDTERMQHWQAADSGEAKIIIGTRSAIWTPLANPGLYIIDEEHDLSYKQQDTFRYSARDMLVIRSTRDRVPAILGSATPSLETLHNANKKRYSHLVLPKRAGNAKPPLYRILDIRNKKMYGPLSQPLIDEMTVHLANKNQVLLFLNRRGYAAHLFCHHCGWKAVCQRCELPFTYHKSKNLFVCHHCEAQKRSIESCPECSEVLLQMGHGTERIETVLREVFPAANVIRIDRDTTRKKNAMHDYIEKINAGEVDILVGTQMLAKGHHFPNITLTGIVDADRGLFSTDFRAGERLAQLFMQVSGRTGRGKKEGAVIVQTHNPDHPLFKQLIEDGYNHCADSVLQDRKLSSLPPYAYMAMLKAEAHNEDDAKHFLSAAIEVHKTLGNNVDLFGPIPAIIGKRSGRYRYQLIIQASDRKTLHADLDRWLDALDRLKTGRKVRWSLDIDPLDMS